MARNIGSQELFEMIHSLTHEEKVYYKKFSKLHIPNGSNYLKLFDAISAQNAFEEISLHQGFKHYRVMKVYLKDYVMDRLLCYRLLTFLRMPYRITIKAVRDGLLS